MDFLRAQEEKAKRMRDATEMYQSVVRKCERAGSQIPPYDFIELIGKGAFGRVYKCRAQATGNLVAIKILNVDEEDFRADFDRMDENIRDFKKEVSILQQLKDSKTKNVNIIHDAFDLHTQLWIVADYCTGGSVRTLMRPYHREKLGLEEKYIIPIARELLVALKGMHDIGIIHRDVKCANVYVTEDGDIQLGDFGIVGVLDDSTSSKRKTIVGTPHWMPKEIVDVMTGVATEEKPYGTEIDIWSYGCTVYEMAAGAPPNNDVGIDQDLAQRLEHAPRLEGDAYSAELKDLISFCLNPDQHARPTAEMILKHPYLSGTSKRYPTTNLIKLIENFKVWEYGGGSRSSLWLANPTDLQYKSIDADDDSDDETQTSDGWNFSTSESFDERLGRRLSTMGSVAEQNDTEGTVSPNDTRSLTSNVSNIAERIKREHAELSANRGEKSLDRLFKTGDYQLHTTAVKAPSPQVLVEPPPSVETDLPLREYTSDAPTRESMIDLGDLDFPGTDGSALSSATSAFYDLNNDLTLKGPSRDTNDDDDDNFQYGQSDDDKRATMEWAFPNDPSKRETMAWTFGTAGPIKEDLEEARPVTAVPTVGAVNQQEDGNRPLLSRTATEPVGHFRDFSLTTPYGGLASASSMFDEYRGSIIDLDAALSPNPAADFAETIGRSSTASSTADSTMTDATSGNPFDLEENPLQKERDSRRFSYHKQWHSEGGHLERRSYNSGQTQMHARGSSLTSNTSSLERSARASQASFQNNFEDRASLLGLGAGFGATSIASEGWPDFGHFTTDAESSYTNNSPRSSTFAFPLTNGSNGSEPYRKVPRSREPDRETLHGTNITFPKLRAPHPNTMMEVCDEFILEDELGRQMETLAESLSALAQVLALHGNVDDEVEESDHRLSELDAGFESTRDTTEDSEESGTDQSMGGRVLRTSDARSPSLLPSATE